MANFSSLTASGNISAAGTVSASKMNINGVNIEDIDVYDISGSESSLVTASAVMNYLKSKIKIENNVLTIYLDE